MLGQNRVSLIALSMTLTVAACSSDETGVTAGSGSDVSEGSSGLVGAWYGSGPDFPDGAQCFVFCENGRLFSGDRPCTDTTSGDFAGFLTYTVTGHTFEGAGPDRVELTGDFEITGDRASFTLDVDGTSFVLPPMSRTADSPLCASDTPIWRGF